MRGEDPARVDPCSILIVDDDPDLCSSLRDVLEAYEFKDVETVGTGHAALAASAEKNYDVVLLDMQLPDMSGLDLVPQLEEILPGADVLVITGYASFDSAAKAVRRSTVAYLTKPVDLERLLAIIDRIARRKQLERENQRLEVALKRREQELFQAQKLETLGRLASGVAHDFNNLLTVIFAEADLTLNRLEKENPLRVHLDRINRAAEQSSELSHRLLSFSRTRQVQPGVCDLNALIRESEEMLSRLIRGEIELRLELASDLGPVRADPAQLEQILVNLVSNARDAMTEGGVLGIETRNGDPTEALGGPVPRPAVILSVTDTGPGIEPEVREKMFEPFFTTREQGTGLGLFMVHGIVEQSGGEIRVDSERGRGATFRVSLPWAEEKSAAASAMRRPEVTGTATVLVVDDNEVVCELAAEALVGAGFKVLSATHGAEALALAEGREEPIDLLVTDVLMPKLSGPELAERLAELFPAMPVLFISGFPDQKLPARAQYLQKPFTMKTLLEKVRSVLAETSPPVPPIKEEPDLAN